MLVIVILDEGGGAGRRRISRRGRRRSRYQLAFHRLSFPGHRPWQLRRRRVLMKWLFVMCAALLLSCASAPDHQPVPEAFAGVPLYVPGGPLTPPRVVHRVEPMPSREFRRNHERATADVE